MNGMRGRIGMNGNDHVCLIELVISNKKDGSWSHFVPLDDKCAWFSRSKYFFQYKARKKQIRNSSKNSAWLYEGVKLFLGPFQRRKSWIGRGAKSITDLSKRGFVCRAKKLTNSCQFRVSFFQDEKNKAWLIEKDHFIKDRRENNVSYILFFWDFFEKNAHLLVLPHFLIRQFAVHTLEI